MSLPVYLDYAATTPVDPDVARGMSECLSSRDAFGNPASLTHEFGRQAAARIEYARAQVAALIGAHPDEILFTSGATESNNLAILGTARASAHRGRHLITSRIEHKAVLDPCRHLEKEGFQVTYVDADRQGRVDPQAVCAAMRRDTLLVTIMLANNEVGVRQDIASIGAACRERGIVLHTDAAQAAGKIPIDVQTLPVDMLAWTAHKLYGPKGVGALYVRRSSRGTLRPIAYGGGQERDLRPGTLPTHQIVGMGIACELAGRLQSSEAPRLERWRNDLWRALGSVGEIYLNGEGAPRLPGLLNVSIAGVEGESLVTGLEELALSTGSACNSASGEPSYVLRALGRDPQLAQSSLRFSFGRFTREADLYLAAAAVRREVSRLRAVSPASQDAHENREAAPAMEGAAGAGLPPMQATVPSEAEGNAAVQHGSPTLSRLARHYFRALPGAGHIAGAPPDILSGEAGRQADGTWVRFSLRVAGHNVKEARFQAFGCPHTLAVAAWLTAQLAGRPLEALLPSPPAQWARAIEVPIEKLGRLLVIEDALRACLHSEPQGA